MSLLLVYMGIWFVMLRPFFPFCLCQWIAREVDLLQNRIDQANEKGWRRQYPFIILFVNILNQMARGPGYDSLSKSKNPEVLLM